MRYNEWQYGYRYDVAMEGDLMIRRERGINLGEYRMFIHDIDRRVAYYAERKFRSIIPFRAPKIWWRKVKDEYQQIQI